MGPNEVLGIRTSTINVTYYVLSCDRVFATPSSVALQAPLSVGILQARKLNVRGNTIQSLTIFSLEFMLFSLLLPPFLSCCLPPSVPPLLALTLFHKEKGSQNLEGMMQITHK